MCECCTPTRFLITGLVFLLFCAGFVLFAVFLPGEIKNLLKAGITKERSIVGDGAQGYEMWKTNNKSGPQYLNLYVFNVTNAPDVLNGLAKPKLQQLGPYVYDWEWHRFDVEFSNDSNSVSFFKSESFVFNREKTTSTLDPKIDKCTFPSIPYAAVRSLLQSENATFDTDDLLKSLELDLISSIASSDRYGEPVPEDETNPFITTTIDQYIWGFDSKYIDFLNKFMYQSNPTHFFIEYNSTSENQTKIDKKDPDIMLTGHNSTQNLNQYKQWEGMKELGIAPNRSSTPFWSSNPADDSNIVHGSDGYGFDIFLSFNETLDIFVEEFFRHINLIINSNNPESLSDIPTYKYEIDQTDFNNVKTNPSYNLYGPNGLLNVTQVNLIMKGSPVPVFISQPMFYLSDPYYASQVEFLPPNNVSNDNQHNTAIWVEPYTGITLKARKRLQVNLQIQGSFLLYPKMGKMIVPIAYFEETADLPSNLADQWKSTVGLVLSFLEAVPLIGYCVSAFFLILTLVMFYMAHKNKQNQKYTPLING